MEGKEGKGFGMAPAESIRPQTPGLKAFQPAGLDMPAIIIILPPV